MREILFRGKGTHGLNSGDWIYGYCVKDFWMPTSSGFGILPIDKEKGGYCEVAPETVGQYTGLTDENGIAMYEGDIIHGAAHWLERYVPAVVTFRNGSFGLLWYRGKVEEFNPFTSMCNVEYTVVGNIYDNPELLKGGE